MCVTGDRGRQRPTLRGRAARPSPAAQAGCVGRAAAPAGRGARARRRKNGAGFYSIVPSAAAPLVLQPAPTEEVAQGPPAGGARVRVLQGDARQALRRPARRPRRRHRRRRRRRRRGSDRRQSRRGHGAPRRRRGARAHGSVPRHRRRARGRRRGQGVWRAERCGREERRGMGRRELAGRLLSAASLSFHVNHHHLFHYLLQTLSCTRATTRPRRPPS